MPESITLEPHPDFYNRFLEGRGIDFVKYANTTDVEPPNHKNELVIGDGRALNIFYLTTIIKQLTAAIVEDQMFMQYVLPSNVHEIGKAVDSLEGICTKSMFDDDIDILESAIERLRQLKGNLERASNQT